MPRRPAAVVALVVCCAALAAYAAPRSRPPAPAPTPAASEGGIQVFFSPNGGAAAALVNLLDSATKSVDVQAYYLTSSVIAKPIADAHARGVKVRVVLDQTAAGEKYSSATYLGNAGVPVWLDGDHEIAHNKVMLVDGETIVTGSFNFTRSADEKHAENLLLIRGKPALYAAYAKNFEAHLQHAKRFESPGK